MIQKTTEDNLLIGKEKKVTNPFIVIKKPQENLGFFLNMTIEKLHHIFLNSSGVCTDSRKIEKDNIFFALKGDNFNGNLFAEQAIQEGCSYAIIDSKEFQKNKQYILVDDVLECLQKLSTYHRKQLNCPVIGITGTNGKTTTKELMYAVLNTEYKTIATQGNFNNHIGVPLTLLSTPLDTEILIVEMGANRPGEIAFLSNIAQPNFGIITNIGKAHLEGFGGYKGVIKTKSELYHYIKSNGGKLFVNAKDELLLNLSKNIERTTYSNNSKFLSANPFVQFSCEETEISSQLIGSYNYPNLAAACCIGKYFGITIRNCKKAIENYTPTNNRSQVEKSNKGNTLILDAYNANPCSMRVAIESLQHLSTTNKIAIIGDMLELGNDSLQEHQEIVELLKASNFQSVFLVGEEFQKTTNSFSSFANTNKLNNWLQSNPITDSTILLKGSRGIRLEDLKTKL